MKKSIQIIIISYLLFVFSFGCKPAEKTAPVLAPETNLTINFSYFTMPADDNTYYAHAFNKTLSWTSLLSDSLQLYTSFVNTLLNKSFVYQDNNTWLISANYNSGDNQYDINYFEILDADTVDTKLFFSLDSTYSNLMLFDGYFIPDSTVGYRLVNKPDTGNTVKKFLSIDWSVISDNQKYLKFTDLTEDKNGNFVIYKDSVDAFYDTYFDLFSKAADNHTIIEYNRTSFIGRIKDEDFFGDDAWKNWDENREDIVGKNQNDFE